MYRASHRQDRRTALSRLFSSPFFITAISALTATAMASFAGCGNSGSGGNNGGEGGAGPGNGTAGTTGTTGTGGAPRGAGGSSGVGVGGAGVGGAGPGGTTGAGGATNADAGTGSDCTTPPPGGTLVGWAAMGSANANGTTGGGSATPVTVTTTAAFNSNAGGAVARVIYVTGSLTGNFTIGSNKTVVGLCGASLHGHVEISGSTNVILRNITIVGYGVGNCALDPTFDATVGCSSGADAVTIINGAQRIWVDHCDVSDGTDGNIDITLGSNLVTISWTKFHYTKRADNGGSDSTGASGHRFSNLVGGGDNSPPDVGKLNITWHHNWWADNVSERQPRVRYGQNHIFNNLYSGAGDDYCVRAGMNAQLLLENNVFTGVASPHQFNSTADQATSFITANNDLYTGTSGTRALGGGGTPFTTPPYAYTLDDTAGLQAAIQAGIGPQ